MSPSRPAHETPVDQAVHPIEGFFRHHRMVVLRPAAKDRIQFGDEILVPHRQMCFHHFPDLAVERFHILPAWFDEQLPFVFAKVPSKEIEAFVHVHDLGLFRRQSQSSLCEKCFHPRPDFGVQQLLRAASDHEIVGVPDHIDFEPLEL
ncbi:hypothetical protein SDC9_77843 [bioreactor metagenome]|uniref:Uncharacterized protein n=1 Tax=bioreactor metagenome TaxID=1076179 RepID=A0A644YTJ0_9ZZZZ